MINPAEIANIASTEESFWWYRGMRAISFALLDQLMAGLSPRAVFEGGCGTGYFASAFAARYGIRVVAADLDAEGARYAANRAGVVGFRADLSHIPLPADHFDLVMLMDVAEHFAPGEDRGLFAECARILRPGGFLFARAAAFRLLRSRHSEFAWTRQRYTRPRLLALCRDAGLEPRRATYANFLLSPIALAKFRVWEPLFDRQPSSGLKRLPGPVEAIFRGALRLEAGLIRRGVSLPFGQTVIVVSRKPTPTVPE